MRDGRNQCVDAIKGGNYVPEECCSFSRNFETGNIEIDYVDLPCGADCDDQCQNCVIQRIMNEYTEQEKELKKYREIGTIEECQVAMEKFIEEAQLHEALRVLDERM